MEQAAARCRCSPTARWRPRAPELKVRRASTRPNRLGFAVPAEYRLSVTAYPGIRPGDVLETLLHELDAPPRRPRRRGPCLARPHLQGDARAGDAGGLRGRRPIRPSSSRHGVYAEAIEQGLRADARI